MNFKGDLFIEKLSKSPKYYEEIFLHTRHNEHSLKESLGIKLHKHNKMYFCRDFRKSILEKRIILNETHTFDEMNDFGINNRGSYTSQSSHDDIAMSCVNLSPIMRSDIFSELIEDMYDILDEDVKNEIQKKIIGSNDIDEDDVSFFNILAREKSIYDQDI